MCKQYDMNKCDLYLVGLKKETASVMLGPIWLNPYHIIRKSFLMYCSQILNIHIRCRANVAKLWIFENLFAQFEVINILGPRRLDRICEHMIAFAKDLIWCQGRIATLPKFIRAPYLWWIVHVCEDSHLRT